MLKNKSCTNVKGQGTVKQTASENRQTGGRDEQTLE